MRNLLKHSISAILLFFSITSFAQAVIGGSIVDQSGEGIAFSNALLVNASDSSLIRGVISDENGQFIFEKIPTGVYLVQANMIGFNLAFSSLLDFDTQQSIQLDPLKLSSGVNLEGVDIVSKKPLYEQKIDRLVVNVENSIVSAGATALEVLERSPGVTINRQQSLISLAGKEGVVVMINEKISYMPVAGVIAFLNSINADNVTSIELITTPPAKFDAQGNAGYINIVLKENPDQGMNGSYTLSGGYGRGAVVNNSLNFNAREGNLNLFGSYSYSLNTQDQLFIFDRTLFKENFVEESTTRTDRDTRTRIHNYRLGTDIQVSPKTIIGAMISGYDNKWTMDAENNNLVFNDNILSQRVTLSNVELNQWDHIGGNVNFSHSLGEEHSLNFDLDYLRYYNENPTDYINRFFDANHNILREELTKSDKTTPINIYVASMDYSKRYSPNFKLGMGLKGTWSDFENDVTVQTAIGGQTTIDPSLTNISQLEEQVLAAYTSADIKLGPNTNAQVGLRYEYTDSKLDSDKEGRVVDRQFGKLFPSIFLSQTINESQGLNFSYSKRVTRPTFNDMAPFVIFIDPTTFFSGNPALQPAFTDAFKVSYRYKTLNISLDYSIQDSTIANFQNRYDPIQNRVIGFSSNLDKTNTWSLTISLPTKITSWWEMRNNLILLTQKNTLLFEGDNISISRAGINLNTTHSFILPKNYSADINFFYNSPSLAGNSRVGSTYMLNFGVQKKISDRWGTLRFNINDVLNSFEWVWESNLGGQDELAQIFDFSQTTYQLTYSRNFGNNKLKSSRNREGGAAEERRRVN